MKLREHLVLFILLPIIGASAQPEAKRDQGIARSRMAVYKVNDVTGAGHSRIPEALREALAGELKRSGRYDVIPIAELPDRAWSPAGPVAPGGLPEELRIQFGLTSRLRKVDYDRSADSFGVKIAIESDLYDAAARELVGRTAVPSDIPASCVSPEVFRPVFDPDGRWLS